MARGHTIARRHEALAEDAEKAKMAFRNYSPPVPLTCDDIANELLYLHGDRAIRSMSDFKAVKTKDAGRRKLAVALHLFGKFRAPYVLNKIWFYDGAPKVNRWGRAAEITLTHREQRLREEMFLIVSGGGSLHKELTSIILTKKETHSFLNCPIDMDFEETMAYAIAGSYTTKHGDRLRIAKSKIKKYFESFDRIDRVNISNVRDFIRFSVVNEISIEEINDIYDFVSRGFFNFVFKGRTLSSVKKAVDDWHRALAREKRLGNRSWDGIPVEDFEYVDTVQDREMTWRIKQITTSKALADEGTAMRHCVYTYQHHCIRGTLSIWSLTLNHERKLTIEVNHQKEQIVQVRGYANRLPYDYEKNIVNRWARQNSIRY